MLPIKKIYIDTRFRTGDSRSHSDFSIDLPTTLLMPEDTGFYIDDVCIPHAWYTVNETSTTRFISLRRTTGFAQQPSRKGSTTLLTLPRQSRRR